MKEKRTFEDFFKSLWEIMPQIDEGYKGEELTVWDLNTAKAQAEFKKFNSYLTEEVAELFDVRDTTNDTASLLDETADIMGFLITLAIKAGYKKDIVELRYTDRDYTTKGDSLCIAGNMTILARDKDQVAAMLFKPVHKMLMVCNLLKNREWKKQNYILDVEAFNHAFISAFNLYLVTIVKLGYSLEQIENAFHAKFKTNVKRINTNY